LLSIVISVNHPVDALRISRQAVLFS